MEGFKKIVSEHVGALIAAVALLAFVVAGSVARCSAIHAPSDAAAQEEESEGGGDGASEAEALSRLDPGLARVRDGYDSDTEEVVALLAANLWSDASDAHVMRFTDRAMVSQDGDEDAWLAYVVTAVRKESAGSGADAATRWHLCVETPDWTSIATISQPAAEDGDVTLACEEMAHGAQLLLTEPSEELEIDGPEEAQLAEHGTDRETVGGALTRWCARSHPTATKATWTGVIEEDHKENVTNIYYSTDGRTRMDVVVRVSMDTGEATCERGSR